MANVTIIQFPNIFQASATKDQIVIVTRKDDLGNILSTNRILLDENVNDLSSDLNLSSFLSGVYDIVFDDATFEDLNILNRQLDNPVNISSKDPLIDILKFVNEKVATDDDTFSHDIGHTNYMVQLVSKDPATLNQIMITSDSGNPLQAQIFADKIKVLNAALNGYTKYEVRVLNRGNRLV